MKRHDGGAPSPVRQVDPTDSPRCALLPGKHKMLWLLRPPCPPRHKMSKNYIRVIPRLSTVWTSVFVDIGPRPRRAAGAAPGRRGRAAARTSGRANLVGPHSRSRPASRERQNVNHRSVVRAAALYPLATVRTRACGAIGEQRCELSVDFRCCSPQPPTGGPETTAVPSAATAASPPLGRVPLAYGRATDLPPTRTRHRPRRRL